MEAEGGFVNFVQYESSLASWISHCNHPHHPLSTSRLTRTKFCRGADGGERSLHSICGVRGLAP
jgi:hypothetical protein